MCIKSSLFFRSFKIRTDHKEQWTCMPWCEKRGSSYLIFKLAGFFSSFVSPRCCSPPLIRLSFADYAKMWRSGPIADWNQAMYTDHSRGEPFNAQLKCIYTRVSEHRIRTVYRLSQNSGLQAVRITIYIFSCLPSTHFVRASVYFQDNHIKHCFLS